MRPPVIALLPYRMVRGHEVVSDSLGLERTGGGYCRLNYTGIDRGACGTKTVAFGLIFQAENINASSVMFGSSCGLIC